MRTNQFNKFIPVFSKKSRLAHGLQVVDQVAGGNIFYVRSSSIKNFSHRNFVCRPQYSADLCNKIVTQEAGGAIPMRLEPGNDFRSDILTGFNGYRAFHRVVGIIINQPDTMLLPQYLVPPVYAFIKFQSFGTAGQVNS